MRKAAYQFAGPLKQRTERNVVLIPVLAKDMMQTVIEIRRLLQKQILVSVE